MTRGVLPAVVVLALGLGLAGCGDDESPSASGATTAPAGSGADAVVAEVTSVAPALESYYRGGPYPQTLDEAVSTLAPAGITLSPGTEVGGYTYDPDAVEFVLCLQDADGAWASYDTAPMGVRDSGTSGGCPAP
ncbi:hypothetical protein [Nocardioides rubriscoriae]|uniref:hypothetical protein n=1 Tax=Nocardioides rubriscoriae TaxID=642762 RepID=UPI0011DFB08E|nr:hypothetical protein [Nocardioides rubriscoriae]